MRRKLVLGIAALTTWLPLGSLNAQDPQGIDQGTWMTADGTVVDPRRPPVMNGQLVRGQSPEDPSDWIDQGGGADGSCNAGCGPQCSGKAGGVWAMGEWLNWQPHRSRSPFVTETVSTLNTLGGDDFDIDPIITDYDRDTGYRVGGGLILACGWDVGVMFTRFDSEGETSVGDATVNADPFDPILVDIGLINEFTNNIGNGTVDAASEFISLKYQIYDLEIGKTFRPSANLALRTFGGVRFAEIDHDRDVTYTDFNDVELDTSGISQDISLHGWGARVGGSLFWDIMSSGFGVFARGGMSIMLCDVEYERTEFAADQEIVAAVSTTTVNRSRIAEDAYEVLPVIEAAIGVRGTVGAFFVNAGWDFTHWFDLATELNVGRESYPEDNQQLRLVIDRGDLSLEGLFINGGVAF